MPNVIKRDGTEVSFDSSKIKSAISKANTRSKEMTPEDIDRIVGVAENKCLKISDSLDVEKIQDVVEQSLLASRFKETAKQYILYRDQRTRIRQSKTKMMKEIAEMVEGKSDYWNNENSNKNAKVVTTQRDYLAGITSTEIARTVLIPADIMKAHTDGLIHIHDLDYYAQNALTNCCLINLDDMLQNGTMINGVKIDKPHKLLTAMTVATQIITAVASSQYGGCSINLSDLAPFVKDSYNKYLNKYYDRGFDKTTCEQYAKQDLQEEIAAAVQTFNYQINSMSTTNGQAPFITVFMYLNENEEYKKEHAILIEEFLKQRMLGLKNKNGVYVTPAFPKLIYVLEEDNISENSKYWYLTQLAAKCTAKRMVPDYISEKIMKDLKSDCYSVMGCRSALTTDRFTEKYGNISKSKNYIEGMHKYSGRFNQGVVTINLPDIAFSSEGNKDNFWKIFDDRLELCHRALKARHDRLMGKFSDMAPILWQDGAFARLAPGEKIDELLLHGYSTISLGYIGLYECTKFMTGVSHTDDLGKAFAIEVMKHMNDACSKWKSEEDIDYSIYGTPAESTTYKFAKCLKKRFGDDLFVKLDGKDRNYITNSYHVPVFEEINPFDKIKLEGQFQALSPGGAISYIETAGLDHNIEAVLEVIKYIYNNCMYCELNTKSDYCSACGYTGEIKIVEQNEKLIWQCPNCGNTDQTKMSVARRTCGYIGTNYWNAGRTNEIRDRYVHLDNHIEND